MSVTPLFGVPTVSAACSGTGALHLAVSRSAAVRLGPVAAAFADLGVPQSVLELSGATSRPRLGPPRTAIAASGGSLASIAAAVESALVRDRPAFALIAGDGDVAVAAAMSAESCGVPIVRIGAGLRCDDRGVEAEVNRVVLDELAARLYVDGDGAAERLQAEGFDVERIVCAGSTLADAIARWQPGASTVRENLGLARGAYVLATLHKPENVRAGARLARAQAALGALARRTPVVVCAHPAMGDLEPLRSLGVIVSEPLDYPDFLALMASAGAVVTDSGGVQEETTVLGVPCFTLARGTERTLTLTHGTNVLLGDDPKEIAEVPIGRYRGDASPIALWDGHAGRRIAADLAEWSRA